MGKWLDGFARASNSRRALINAGFDPEGCGKSPAF
jgi:hypothetical protein